ncbi:SH2 domain-containing protein 3C-like isoform X2 [Leptonychotes weddellii]|uniref:SH2 domain-containing protein 3C-like isoform X2 n=1 Tax=Leptonychotes weddellii TaxID=9713 RepID=A0A7F8Q211_LEPWE|nr:SH2 domain-containing protein 3C-like isoform X2 [Leptonychotes weddellii]
MTEGPKKASRKFKFFKFKGIGSLSNLPRSFTLKRSSTTISLGSHLEPDPFEATQDDMVTVPKSPLAYARSSDMYSHMGTMPRLSTKKARDQQATQETKEVGPEPHLVPQGLPNPPGVEAAKEVVVGTNVPLEDTPAVGPNPSAMGPMEKPEDPRADRKEERAPRNVPPERWEY